MKAQLRVISGPYAGETLLLDRTKFIVGREQDCQLRPDSEFISRHHCVFLLDEFALRIRDLGSKNGTIVNGRRVEGEVVLCHDDMISLGEMTIQIDLLGDDGSALDHSQQGTEIFDGNTKFSDNISADAESPHNTPDASAPSPPENETEHLSNLHASKKPSPEA